MIRWITTHEIRINIQVNLISGHADRPGPRVVPSAHFGVQHMGYFIATSWSITNFAAYRLH
jgi:hypothetical protein